MASSIHGVEGVSVTAAATSNHRLSDHNLITGAEAQL